MPRKDGACLQQRSDDCGDQRMIGYELTNAILKLDRANNTDLEPEIAKRTTEIILYVINLPLEELTGGQQKTPMLARRRLDVHGLE
jgi:hypothetical protein